MPRKGGASMKKRLLAGALCALLLLSGCSPMLERSYSSHTTHTDTSEAGDANELRAEDYDELLACVMRLVRAHEPYGTIRLYNYAGTVEDDLKAVCDQVRFRDPLGAYAVRAISCESTRVLSYYEVDARIVYAHTADAVAAIVPAAGLEALRAQLNTVVEYQRTQTTLYLTDYEGSAQQIDALFRLALYSAPAAAAMAPAPTVTLYPAAGTERVLELQANWSKPTPSRLEYAAQLSQLCAELLGTAEPTGQFSVPALARQLSQVLVYDPGGSRDAVDALQGLPANDLGVLLAMEALCAQAGIEVQAAMDSAGSQLWLIVSTPSGCRHLLPKDLRPDAEQGPNWQLPLYTDEELAALGFTWQEELFPPCVDYAG